MAAVPSVLAALVAPHPVEEFLTAYWPEKPFVAHGDVARLPSFLRMPELASVEALSRPYRGRVRFTNGRKYEMMVQVEQVNPIDLYRMGLTVQFEDIVAMLAPAAAELRQLEFELGVNPGAARATAFASPVTDGLSVHCDAYDVFSVQLRGGKRFHIAPVTELPFPSGVQFIPGGEAMDEMYPQTLAGFPEAPQSTFTTIEMKPGSVLYVPRGTWHHTESEGDSLAVSIAIFAPAAAEVVLNQLRLLLLQKPEWRRPLYGAWGDDAAREAATARASALLDKLPEVARQLKAAPMMANVLPLERRLDGIKPKSEFQKTPHSRVHVEPATEKTTFPHEVLTITLWDPGTGERPTVRMKVAPAAVAVFRWLAERKTPFTAGELSSKFPQFPFTEHQQILRTATECGLLKMLWFQTLG
ncbi:MAG TPA: cupin domain-containing protein [Burkholderiaceae bacterium]|nr:cupin domain-containing protein [Burkholderiaceae bacterium]